MGVKGIKLLLKQALLHMIVLYQQEQSMATVERVVNELQLCALSMTGQRRLFQANRSAESGLISWTAACTILTLEKKHMVPCNMNDWVTVWTRRSMLDCSSFKDDRKLC